MASSDHVPHLQVKFFTKQEKYSIPDSPYSVPATVVTTDLSNLVNSVLQPDASSSQQAAFDFLIQDQFLRQSLREHVDERNISTESVVEIEYVERQPAPEPEDSLQHDDWVSAIHALNDCILTGCYDNTLHVWNTEGDVLVTIPSHTAPVKCVTWLNNVDEEPIKTFLSGSHDQTVLMWQWNQHHNNVECLQVCRGHAGSVDCVSVSEDKTRFCSGSWDRMLKIWSVDQSTVDDDTRDDSGETPQKRQKTDTGKVATKVPLMTLSGHTEGVSSSLWLSQNEVCTGSWDHTIRLWDLERAVQTSCLTGSKVVFSIAWSPLNRLLLAGSADRHVRLYDPRSTDGAIVKCNFTSHNAWVSGVDWSPTNENLFISGSYDHMVKLWDLRSPKVPLFDLKGHEERVLSVDWSMPQYMLSGGADNSLKIFKYAGADKSMLLQN